MGRYLGPSCRQCRAEGLKLFLKGDRCKGPKCAVSKRRLAPGRAPKARMRKRSDYGVQLREKQKLKRFYAMLEGQFKLSFSKAVKAKGVTGEALIRTLETRLDNVIYRMHFASSRKQARQIISHGHVAINGHRVSIPACNVREGDEIEIMENSKKLTSIKESLKEYSRAGAVQWLEVDPDRMWGKVKAMPRRDDFNDLAELNEQLIVELYSK